MIHAESRLQQACVRWFRLAHRDLALLLNAVPNGAKVSQSQARILVGEGLTKGVADLELNMARGEWHGLKIEMKTESEGGGWASEPSRDPTSGPSSGRGRRQSRRRVTAMWS